MQDIYSEPVTDRRKLAQAVIEIIEEGSRWDQVLWISASWYWIIDPGHASQNRTASAEKLRELQADPVCGTTACVAGHTAILAAPAGSVFRWSDDRIVFPDGTVKPLSQFAREALGLRPRSGLFAGEARKEYVLAILRQIADGTYDRAPEPSITITVTAEDIESGLRHHD